MQPPSSRNAECGLHRNFHTACGTEPERGDDVRALAESRFVTSIYTARRTRPEPGHSVRVVAYGHSPLSIFSSRTYRKAFDQRDGTVRHPEGSSRVRLILRYLRPSYSGILRLSDGGMAGVLRSAGFLDDCHE